MIVSPVGRGGTPEDIAGLVSYLASKDAFMVTGTFGPFYSDKLINKHIYQSSSPLNRPDSK